MKRSKRKEENGREKTKNKKKKKERKKEEKKVKRNEDKNERNKQKDEMKEDVCPVGWGCRIHRLLLCRGVRPPLNECPGYDTKQSECEVPAVLELWGMRSTPSLPSLPGPLCPGVVAPEGPYL